MELGLNHRAFAVVSIAMFLLSACSGDAGGMAGAGNAPTVVVGAVERVELVDRIEAIGTAHANEQATLASIVTERIARVNYADGARVVKGAVIAELVRTAQGASLHESQARAREAEQQLARLQQLQTQGFATRARIDEQQAAVDVARAQASLARSDIGDRVIRAPFSGWLSLRRVSPGDVVSAGTTIATIVDHSRIKLDFPVPEIYLSLLKTGLEIEATAAAWPGEVFRGEISSVDPTIDPVSRATMVRAIVPNPDLKIRPGMLMMVQIRSAPRTVLVVPELAVVGEGGAVFVWTVDAENNAARQVIEAGTRRQGMVEVVSGLEEGQRIIVDGTVKVRAAGPVTPMGGNDAGGEDSGVEKAA